MIYVWRELIEGGEQALRGLLAGCGRGFQLIDKRIDDDLLGYGLGLAYTNTTYHLAEGFCLFYFAHVNNIAFEFLLS